MRIYIHMKKLGNTYCITRVNFGTLLNLRFFLNCKQILQNCLINQHLQYPKWLQREHCKYIAIEVAARGQLVYKNIIYDFLTSLVIAAIKSFNEARQCSFYVSILRLIACLTNFDSQIPLRWPFVGGACILCQQQDPMTHFLLRLYIWQPVTFQSEFEYDHS